jgi:6-phosphogluconolactonase (cycloisomerase 2 family)
VADDPNASWLAFSPDRRFLYSTNETDDGTVTALDVTDPAHPKVLNRQSSGGDVPTHLSVDPSGRFLFVANYGSGSVAVLPIGCDGRLGGYVDLVQHQPGSRPPNAHQVITDPSGDWVISVDLGADSVFVHGLDPSTGKLTEHQHLVLPDGAGPRHVAFDPSGRVAYIVQELRSEVTVAAWDPATGTLTPGQVVATVGPHAPAANYPGEIQVAADGRFVYVSNRGENSIATFSVGEDGTLTLLGHTPTGGDWPRHFTLDAAEEWVYVSNQRSGTVTWLPLDKTTGAVGPSTGSLAVPQAAMVLLR